MPFKTQVHVHLIEMTKFMQILCDIELLSFFQNLLSLLTIFVDFIYQVLNFLFCRIQTKQAQCCSQLQGANFPTFVFVKFIKDTLRFCNQGYAKRKKNRNIKFKDL